MLARSKTARPLAAATRRLLGMSSSSDTTAAAATATTTTTKTSGETFQFGQYRSRAAATVASTELSRAFTNLKPLQRHHVLVIPHRVVPRFQDLRADEMADLWLLAQRVGRAIERNDESVRALTFGVQDGVAAGQTVHHVHVHVMPRREGDFKSDELWEKLDRLPQENKRREPRTEEEMASEARLIASWLHADDSA